MLDIDKRKLKINFNLIAILFILIGEICFYTEGTLILYIALTGLGILLSFILNIDNLNRRIRKRSFIIWILAIYSLYFLYGIFFIQAGIFPGEVLLYRLVESISLYMAIRKEVKINPENIIYPFLIAGIFSVLYLLAVDGNSIFSGSDRIGNGLSGNVNSVGYSFGIITTLIMWWNCSREKWWKIIILIFFFIIMLLTGSKKCLIILLLNLFLKFLYERGNVGNWFKILAILILGSYLIFNVSYFYDIIGHRIDDMMNVIISGDTGASYSTEMREKMIEEGIKFFWENPILGGGWNYFYARTSTAFDYSHNNYTEILCSFGIIGICIFYYRHVIDVLFCLKRIFKKKYLYYDYLTLSFVYVLISLFLDFAAVTFSAQSIWYVPLIIASAFIDELKNRESDNSES